MPSPFCPEILRNRVLYFLIEINRTDWRRNKIHVCMQIRMYVCICVCTDLCRSQRGRPSSRDRRPPISNPYGDVWGVTALLPSSRVVSRPVRVTQVASPTGRGGLFSGHPGSFRDRRPCGIRGHGPSQTEFCLPTLTCLLVHLFTTRLVGVFGEPLSHRGGTSRPSVRK